VGRIEAKYGEICEMAGLSGVGWMGNEDCGACGIHESGRDLPARKRFAGVAMLSNVVRFGVEGAGEPG
jgi:hypothetical protein